MNETKVQSIQEQQAPSPAEDPRAARAEIARLNAEAAELKATIEAQSKQLEALPALQAEVETLRAEKADAALQAKRARLFQYAKASKLDLENEAVKAAIENGDIEALMAEALSAAPTEKQPAATLTLSAEIQQSPYGGLLDPNEWSDERWQDISGNLWVMSMTATITRRRTWRTACLCAASRAV